MRPLEVPVALDLCKQPWTPFIYQFVSLAFIAVFLCFGPLHAILALLSEEPEPLVCFPSQVPCEP